MTKLEVGKEYWVKGEVMTRTNRGTYTVIKFANDEQRIWLEGPNIDGVQVVEAIPEREKVTIEWRAAKYIEIAKAHKLTLRQAINDYKPADSEIFARAWLDGYEIKKKEELEND